MAFFNAMNQNPESTIPKNFTFRKEERLCSKKLFDRLFNEGISFLVFPLKVVVVEADFQSRFAAKAAFAVSKKNFNKAVKRNRIKRLMREAYRLNKHALYDAADGKKLAVIFVYIAKEELAYSQIETAIKKAIQLIPGKLETSQE